MEWQDRARKNAIQPLIAKELLLNIFLSMSEFQGKVIKSHIAAGSKSERDAVCLEIDGRQYVLRRKRGNPFYDEELEKLVGKTIRAAGDIVGGYVLLMSDWAEL